MELRKSRTERFYEAFRVDFSLMLLWHHLDGSDQNPLPEFLSSTLIEQSFPFSSR